MKTKQLNDSKEFLKIVLCDKEQQSRWLLRDKLLIYLTKHQNYHVIQSKIHQLKTWQDEGPDT